MKVLIKGAGDLASGIACRLDQCGFQIVMTEQAVPTAVRRSVSFSRAIYEGEAQVEESKARLCHNMEEIEHCLLKGEIAVIVDEKAEILRQWRADVVVDAILAKKNLGSSKEDAPIVIAVGPGFTASKDCHCVIESKRGHDLGRCIYEGSAIPNTGVPGNIGGYTKERILRAPADGIFHPCVSIGDFVKKGQVCGLVDDQEMLSNIDGVVRGLLQDGVPVNKGMKSGDVDPRCMEEHCYSVSDKARAIAGGVLEAILHLKNML